MIPRTRGRISRAVFVTAVMVIVVIGAADPALAADGLAAPASLQDVISNLKNWIVGLLVGLATLFLTIGGVRYLAANGDPGQVERAKSALRSSAIGYSLAALAPMLVTALQSVVG